MLRVRYKFILIISAVAFALATCIPVSQPLPNPSPTPDTHLEHLERDPDVPELPFPDNPDPNQCGIPTLWGTDESAWVSGYYRGELIQPIVFLYDSHLRLSIAGTIPSGTEVTIVLYQLNPTLDFYLVKTIDIDPPQEGWIPAPFLSFEPTD